MPTMTRLLKTNRRLDRREISSLRPVAFVQMIARRPLLIQTDLDVDEFKVVQVTIADRGRDLDLIPSGMQPRLVERVDEVTV